MIKTRKQGSDPGPARRRTAALFVCLAAGACLSARAVVDPYTSSTGTRAVSNEAGFVSDFYALDVKVPQESLILPLINSRMLLTLRVEPATDPLFPPFRPIPVDPLLPPRDHIDEYLEKSPWDHRAWMQLGIQLYRRGEIDDSLGAITEAYKLKPDDPYYIQQYASILAVAGQYQKGLAIMESFLTEFPDNPVIRFNLACTYARLDMPEAAMRELELLNRSRWKDLYRYIGDKDLDTLREREDFQKLFYEPEPIEPEERNLP